MKRTIYLLLLLPILLVNCEKSDNDEVLDLNLSTDRLTENSYSFTKGKEKGTIFFKENDSIEITSESSIFLKIIIDVKNGTSETYSKNNFKEDYKLSDLTKLDVEHQMNTIAEAIETILTKDNRVIYSSSGIDDTSGMKISAINRIFTCTSFGGTESIARMRAKEEHCGASWPQCSDPMTDCSCVWGSHLCMCTNVYDCYPMPNVE